MTFKIMKIDGVPVSDAKKPMNLVITDKDIKGATKKDPGLCAAALACMRQTKALEARIHLGRIYIRTSKKTWLRFATPKSLRSEVIAFDRGGQFMAGEYRLTPVTPGQQGAGGYRGERGNRVGGQWPKTMVAGVRRAARNWRD